MYNTASYKHFRRVAQCVRNKNNYSNLGLIKRVLFYILLTHPLHIVSHLTRVNNEKPFCGL